MALSNNQTKNICLKDSGSKTCRYLFYDDFDEKCYCLKLSSEKLKIDKKVNDFIMSCKIKKIDPNTLNTPLGNNCDGFLFLRNLEQGV